MFLRREGFPEEGELVQCTITKIQYNSVFAKLSEYDKVGMIHISEISPGRIRNIRDFVIEGKIVICMVLKINLERGYIDLSLRRVNNTERIKKTNEVKHEQKAEKIIEMIAEQQKIPPEEVYKLVAEPILKKYRYLHHAFDDVITQNLDLSSFEIRQDICDPLKILIKEKIKPREVSITGELKIVLYEIDGLDIIKKTLLSIKNNHIIISYLGGGKYGVTIIAPDYKIAEKELKDTLDSIEEKIVKAKGEYEFKRKDKK
jgi:translation initiation factor 2 subunit 1